MDLWGEERLRIGLVAIAIAVGGLILTLRIKRVAPAATAQPWPAHPWSMLPEGLRRLGASRCLAVAVASIVFFETTASLVMLDALMVVKLELGASDAASGALCGFAAVGCGIGALLLRADLQIDRRARHCADRRTRNRGRALCAGDGCEQLLGSGRVPLRTGSVWRTVFSAFLAWIQKSTRPDEKGLILSTNNLLSMAGVLSASIALGLLHDVLGLTPKAIFAVAGAVTLLYVATILVICREIRCRLVVFAGTAAGAISFQRSATTN